MSTSSQDHVTEPLPLVSVLVSAFNEEKYITASVDSCLGQTYDNVEVLIFNDGSTDNTLDILTSNYKKDQRVKILDSKDNVGKITGFNAIFKESRGEYIHLLGGDDILVPDCIENCLMGTRKANFDAFFHGAKVVDENLNSLNWSIYRSRFDTLGTEEAIANMASVPSGVWFINRKTADKIFPIPLKIPYEDVWMSAMIKSSNAMIGKTEVDLYLYRQHDKNTFGRVHNTDFQIAKFRYQRNVLYINYILETDVFRLSDNAKSKLEIEKVKLSAILGCNNMFDVAFSRLPFLKKIDLFLDSHATSQRLKKKIANSKRFPLFVNIVTSCKSVLGVKSD